MPADRPSPRPDKRRALLDGALAVFARDGYTRARIEEIAQAAHVSTRTIYNHYGDKATLFRAVIVDSAERRAQHEIEVVRWTLGRVREVEEGLVEFGLAWSAPDPASASHVALVRQVAADAGHLPQEALDAWLEAGPHRVRAEIATHLRRLSDDGLLDVDDELVAAVHLVQLTTGSVHPYPVVTPVSEAEVDRVVRAGVRLFLSGYRGRGGAVGAR